MSRTSSRRGPFDTVAELLDRLGGIPASRVRLRPPPGLATERDVTAVHDRDNRLCELVDGTLVEKAVGYPEAVLALELGRLLGNYVVEHDLGLVTGADGMVRLLQGLVRIPDVAFVRWDRFPGRKLSRRPIPNLVPDLAVEILSPANTAREMERKLREYFLAGVRLVWLVDPDRREVTVYSRPDRPVVVHEKETLDGGDVLPGFTLPVAALFRRLPPAAKSSRRRRSSRGSTSEDAPS